MIRPNVRASFGRREAEILLAVAGPGCQTSPGASYANAGRWDSAEGTASWATRVNSQRVHQVDRGIDD